MSTSLVGRFVALSAFTSSLAGCVVATGDVDFSAAAIGAANPPGVALVCGDTAIHFAGRCRRLAFFDRFVAPGATRVSVEGANEAGHGIMIYEMPDAHTHVVRSVSDVYTEDPSAIAGHKYMAGYEVLFEHTFTSWVGEDGSVREAQTIDSFVNGEFQNIWQNMRVLDCASEEDAGAGATQACVTIDILAPSPSAWYTDMFPMGVVHAYADDGRAVCRVMGELVGELVQAQCEHDASSPRGTPPVH
jgi:hypothetical protein